MFDSPTPEDDEFLSCDKCAAFGQCDEHIDPYSDEFEYDDPFDVVMYDIDVEDDDLYALIDMLGDTTRSWYARRRLNALAAAGPLRALVADIIVDSLGRNWNPLEHPRDRFGRFINTGGFFRWLADASGDWLRGRVERIDSDGVIHARSIGNDRIPDGQLVRFNPEMSSKLVSIADPLADLDAGPEFAERYANNLDAEIPNFPEASPTQRRIYNALADGNMPAEDLDRFFVSESDVSQEDFIADLQDLQTRGLVEIDSSGSRPRVERTDLPEADETDAGDIADVPDDEVPELDDSPALTGQQRDLLDRIAELDRGEGDGVASEEMANVAEEDIQALVDAGALDESDGRYHLTNPETGTSELDAPETPADEGDIFDEILDAAEVLDDPDSQDAFQHYALALAEPGREDEIELPEGLSPAKLRNAQQAADKWWAERNGEADAPEVDADAPKVEDVLNPRNQALADGLAEQWFNGDDKFLDSDEGIEYRAALKRFFDAADMEENGFENDAKLERLRAESRLRRIKVEQDVIDGWPAQVQTAREAAPQDVVPEDVAPDVVPEEVVPSAEEVVPDDVVPDDVQPLEDVTPELDEETLPEPAANPWDAYQSQLDSEGEAGTYGDRIDQELRVAEDHGINLVDDEDGRVTWNFMANMLEDDEAAERLFNDSDGSLGKAAALYINEPDKYKVPNAPEDAVDVPEDVADVPEADAPEADAPEDVVDAAPTIGDDQRDLLSTIQDGGQAKRSQRALEDSLIEAGLLEEDESGDSRLTDAGRAALGDDTVVPEAVVPDTPEAEAVVPNDVVPDDAPAIVPDAVDDVVPDDVVPDDVVDEAITDFASAPSLPNPADPNEDSMAGFQKTAGQGGLNAGGFYDVLEDNGPLKAGDKVYIKNGRSPEHAQNEVLASQLYTLAGVDTPEVYLGDSGDRLVSKIIDDLGTLDPYNPNNQASLDKVRGQFAVDAWLANWDGQQSGNTMLSPDGTPYRIDSGSAMEFRAQGQLKGAAFGDTVDEIDNLRDSSMNYESARVFGPMSDEEVKASVEQFAQVDPDEIRSLITASGLPESDSLAEKMVTRRSNLLQRFGVDDPHATGGTAPAPVDTDVDTDVDTNPPVPAMPAPTNAQIAKAVKAKTPKQVTSLNDFTTRTNPHLEPSYTGGGELVMADGSVLDLDAFYHTGAGGEGKHGRIVEVLDQEKYAGWIRMEFPDGTEQVRHVLGTGAGGGGLRQSSEETLEDWERQTSVTGDKATGAFDPSDFPMSDGAASIPGTRIVFDVGGEEQFGTLLYINPKLDKGKGGAYIIPEGGGKVYQRNVKDIRSQTPDEIDLDAVPAVAYQRQGVKTQYLPAPSYTADGKLLSREGQPINLGDWMSQRSGGDNLVGEVIDFPDQNLYPGWVTLRFPDGEVRVRHVEGYTDINKARGAGGLRHSEAPNTSTWTRQRRVKGEEGDVLSYDFSTLDTVDGSEIHVGQEVFGTDRRGRPISGMLIRINPHLKRNGQVVPTGFILQGNNEIAVDVAKITNTPPAPVPQAPRPIPRPQPNVTPNVPTPSNTRVVPTPTVPAGTNQRTRPALSAANTPPSYSPSKGHELSDEELLNVPEYTSQSSTRTNGYQYKLAALYEAQDYDGLPTVVDQTEFARLVQEEGYIPILRSVHPGIDPTTKMSYDDAYRYGAYFAGWGAHGYGTYFAYGPWSVRESGGNYGPHRIYAAVRPSDMKIIDKNVLVQMKRDEINELTALRRTTARGSDERKLLDQKLDLYDDLGQYATAKGYDAINVPEGNGNTDGSWSGTGSTPADDNLEKRGYIVLLNRSASIVSDTHFEDHTDIFRNGFNFVLAPAVPEEVAAPVDAGEVVAPAAPGVV